MRRCLPPITFLPTRRENKPITLTSLLSTDTLANGFNASCRKGWAGKTNGKVQLYCISDRPSGRIPELAHAYSRDSWAHEATSARAVGSTWRKTLYVVGSNAFRRKKNHTLREQIWQGRNQGMGRCPPSGGRTYRGKAGECPCTFAGFVGPRSDIGPRTLGAGGGY